MDTDPAASLSLAIAKLREFLQRHPERHGGYQIDIVVQKSAHWLAPWCFQAHPVTAIVPRSSCSGLQPASGRNRPLLLRNRLRDGTMGESYPTEVEVIGLLRALGVDMVLS